MAPPRAAAPVGQRTPRAKACAGTSQPPRFFPSCHGGLNASHGWQAAAEAGAGAAAGDGQCTQQLQKCVIGARNGGRDGVRPAGAMGAAARRAGRGTRRAATPAVGAQDHILRSLRFDLAMPAPRAGPVASGRGRRRPRGGGAGALGGGGSGVLPPRNGPPAGGGGGGGVDDRWLCEACTLMNAGGAGACAACGGARGHDRGSDDDGELGGGASRPPPTLAQRLGLVAPPPTGLSAEQWAAAEARAVKRGDVAGGCAICMEPLGGAEQVILSCTHVFHRACLSSFERCVRGARETRVCMCACVHVLGGVMYVCARLMCVCTDGMRVRVRVEGAWVGISVLVGRCVFVCVCGRVGAAGTQADLLGAHRTALFVRGTARARCAAPRTTSAGARRWVRRPTEHSRRSAFRRARARRVLAQACSHGGPPCAGGGAWAPGARAAVAAAVPGARTGACVRVCVCVWGGGGDGVRARTPAQLVSRGGGLPATRRRIAADSCVARRREGVWRGVPRDLSARRAAPRAGWPRRPCALTRR